MFTIRTLHLTSCFCYIICLLDSDIDDISIPVQFIIDQNLLSLGIACLILFLPLIIITEHLQIFVTAWSVGNLDVREYLQDEVVSRDSVPS